jgi:hypothetical protein
VGAKAPQKGRAPGLKEEEEYDAKGRGRAEEEEADDEGEEPLETSGIRARSAKEQTHVDMMNRGASFPVEFHEESGLEESGDESIGAVACACAGTSICWNRIAPIYNHTVFKCAIGQHLVEKQRNLTEHLVSN